MKHLVSSWNAISKETFVNCFKKCNISQSNQQAAVNDDDDPFKSLQKDVDKLHELDNDAIQPNLSAEWFADLDSEVATSASSFNDDDIIAEVIEGEMKRAKMIKMIKKVPHQRVHQLMKLKTCLKRWKTFPCLVHAETKFAPLCWAWKAC